MDGQLMDRRITTLTGSGLAERMYEARRTWEGLKTPWTGLPNVLRKGYLVMAESAIDAMTQAMIRQALDAQNGPQAAQRRKLVISAVENQP